MQHKEYIQTLLDYNCGNETSIVDVIGKMGCLLNYFKSQRKYRNFVPFLEVYYKVTESVLNEYWKNENFYKDFEHTETFDVKFAELYFIPIRNYLLFDKKDTPWKTYFDYCEKTNGSPFVQIMLGINAHINSDLLTTLLDYPYKHKEDYLIVNEILLQVIPDIMLELFIYHKDLYGLGGLILQPFTKYEFNETVVRWRTDVWNNSLLIKSGQFPASKKLYHQLTEEMGENIIQIFENINSFDSIFKDLERLNKLKMELRYVSLKDFR